MKRPSGLQEDDKVAENKIKTKPSVSPGLLPSTGSGQENRLTTTTSMTNGVDEEKTTTTKIKATTSSNVEFAAINDYCDDEKGAVTTETIQKINNGNVSRGITLQEEVLEEFQNEISGIDGNSNASSDARISDHPGAVAVQGLRFNTDNTTEDGTVQYSMKDVEKATRTQEEEALANAIQDPHTSEHVMETIQGVVSVTLDQNDSPKWKRLGDILGIFVLILFVIAAVLVPIFVISNKNTVASVNEQIMNVLIEYFPDMPATNDQKQAWEWILTDPTTLEVIMEEGEINDGKKRLLLERFVLATLYYATNGSEWQHDDFWLSRPSVCRWSPSIVHCQPDATVDQEYVTFIDLSSNNVRGTIPTGIGLMTNMNTLFLDFNYLSGLIPTELGLMTSMEWLDLGNNYLPSGSIPTELGLMTSMIRINLWSNDLKGTIPTELGLLKHMIFLDLRYNALSGSIPTELGLMTSMRTMDFGFNALTGSIPTELGILTSLEGLSLYDNALSGSIPTELGLLTSIEDWLALSKNALTGSIPTELGLITSMKHLNLDDNALTGLIPTELGLMTSLVELYLNSNNALSGSIPSEFGLLTSLSVLYLYNNALTGSIPTELGLITNMREMLLDSNSLTGSIPTEFGLLTMLSRLNLSGNSNLTGTIPPEVVAILPYIRSCYMGNTSLIDVPKNCRRSLSYN